MKNKVLLFIIAIFLFGIVNVKAATKDINITNVEVIDKSGTITVVDPVFSSNEITSNITFNQKDDFVTFEMTLKNNESEKYKVESIKDNNSNQNLKLEYDYDKNYISNGESLKIKVKLIYDKQLKNVDRISLNDLQIIINLVNEEGDSGEIIINPITGDNIIHYLVLLIITLTGLIIVRKNKKLRKVVLVLPMLILPFVIFARSTYRVDIKFVDIDIIGEFETYNITINPDNGDPVSTRTITYGDPIGTLPANPSKEGYEFVKWVDNKGNEVTDSTIITGPITVKAKYNAIKYDITYDYAGGTGNNPSKYTIEDSITLSTPTRNGYSFAGWIGTDITTPQSTVTIPVGSTGPRSYTATWSARTDTPYRIIHKYPNLDPSTYTDVVRNLTGPTGETITAAFESKYGFNDPGSTQDITIDAEELQVVTYYYTRKSFNFSITDRTYVDSSSTLDNSYPYETNIHVKALERPGYSFTWSDGNTNYERTFKLEEDKTLEPVYTANTNTPYKVKHYKMDLNGTSYSIADTQNLTGTTDAPITPETNTYEGFTAPVTQTTTISGTGNTVVEYYYTRNTQHLTINNPEYVSEGDLSDDYFYEEEITLTAINRPGYTFSKWNDVYTTNPVTITIGTSDITVGPEYTANTNTPYKVKHYKMDTNGTTYTIADTVPGTGTTGSSITPATNNYEGFTAPATQTTTISGNGDTVVEYYYTRNQYTLTIIDSQFVEQDKSGLYYYEEQVTLTAIDREGYRFSGWSSGGGTKTTIITIPVGGITVKPLYAANTDTTYSVKHKYRKLTQAEEYDEVTITGTGTTGDTIPAPLNPRTGFVSPSIQNITITADGQAEVTYTYQRETYAFNITDRTYLDSSSTANGTYPYETPITLKATSREGYTFKWSDNVTDLERSFNLTAATTLSLEYTANKYYVHFDKNDELATGVMQDQEFEYDTPENLDSNLFVKTGYTFTGWNTRSDGEGTNYSNEVEVTNLATSGTVNLYAKWAPNTNTPYKVIHKKQKVTLDGYDEIVENLTGTSDASITPTVNNYTGFTKPNAQTTTISRLGDTVVTYVYDREIYTITFNTDGGSTELDQQVAYGAKATRPATDPTKQGYTFDNWYADSNYQTLFDFDEPITGSVPIYAKFDINTYTVTFDTAGGSSEPAQVIAHGGHVTRPSTDPTKTGYTFDNWYADNQYQTLFDFSNTTITAPTTIYAKFEIKTFTVTFDTDGGSIEPPRVVSYGDYITRPSTDPTKVGYTFDNWYKDSNYQTLFSFNNETITGPTTIYAKFDINSYTVTFDTDGGSSEPAQVIAHGGYVTRPSTDPTKTGYTFDNWYADSQYQTLFDFSNTTITGPITIYAKFDINSYTVTFDTDSGSSEPSQTINYGGHVTRPSTDPTKTGYTFDNWYKDSNYQTLFDFTNETITGPTTIYAKFDINTYTVTFDTDGGSSEPAQVIAYNGYVTRPSNNPTKQGYNFINWYADSQYQTLFDFTNITITGPTTIYGKFEIQTFTVTFDTDGGSSVPSQTINYGGTVTRPSTDPTKQGYTFINWYEDGNYQTLFDFTNTTITSPTTIYAKFVSQSSTITVSFGVDGGTTVNPITITRGDSINDLPITSKQDYNFLGWYLDLSDPYPVSEPFTPTADVELKAKWQKVLCKKATVLDTAVCHSDSDKGCRRAGYADGDIVTYGNIVSSDTLVNGDELLCDVDGTGYNKKFYYMRTLNGNAVLLYDSILVADNDPDYTNYVYDTAKTILPDTSTWSNLPVTFENDTKAARFPTLDDTREATGKTDLTSTNSLAEFPYIFKNLPKYTSSASGDTIWLNEVINEGVTYRYRVHVNSVSVVSIANNAINTSKNCVKPVIEVPLELIEDDYVVRFNPVGGTIANEYVRVKKGTALGTLPTVTKTGYVFDDWYTSLQYTTTIDANTVPSDYDTYYAKWLVDLNDAVIPDEIFALEIGDEDDIVINDLSTVEPVTFTSNDTSVVTVDSNGHIVGLDEGTTTITITGTISGHTRTINIRVVTVLTDFVVSFDSQGGTPVGDMSVPRNTAIGSLPSPDPTKTDYVFGGWYTNTSYTTKVTVDTVIRDDVTFYAKWIPDDAECEMNGDYYNSLQTAVDTAGNSKTTIILVKDVSLSSSLDLDSKNTTKNIVLDLDGHTLSSTSGQTIKTKATLEIKNGTVTNGTANGAVDIGTGGHLILNSGSITQTATGNNGRAAVYNNGGTVEIGGTAYLTSNAYWTTTGGRKRGTVQNVLGTMTITGGTIINTRSSTSYGVSIESGTVVIGTNDGAYDVTNLIIQGETGGIYSAVGYSLFDGLIKGKTYAVQDESKITGYETGSTKVNDNDGTYNILYYTIP